MTPSQRVRARPKPALLIRLRHVSSPVLYPVSLFLALCFSLPCTLHQPWAAERHVYRRPTPHCPPSWGDLLHATIATKATAMTPSASRNSLTYPNQGKRVFIKDISMYIVPPKGQPARIAPTLQSIKRGVGTGESSDESDGGSSKQSSNSTTADSAVAFDSPPKSPRTSPPFPYQTPENPRNPTVVPREVLERFHFTFLIRHPKFAIPSYYRCCIPPLLERTGFEPFMPCEAGYAELRRLFDYCKDAGLVGPAVCGQDNSAVETKPGQVEICVIDADDLLNDPQGILKRYCESIGLDFVPGMLKWDSEEAHQFAKEQFEKWNGFHDDAIGSKDLKPRQHVSETAVASPHTHIYSHSDVDITEERPQDGRADAPGMDREVRQRRRRHDQVDRG